MANSSQRAIRAAVAGLFTAGTALAGGRVYQNRVFSLAAGVNSQVHVNYVDSVPERAAIFGAPIEWTTQIEVVIKARRSGGASAEDRADEIWVDAYSRVMAAQSLGGLASGLDPGPASVGDDELDTDTCRLTWALSVRHSTANNSIASP